MNKFTVTKAALLPRLLMLMGSVDKRQSVAILANFLFQVKDATLTIIATDLEIEMVAVLPCEMTGESFSFTVSAKKLVDIVKSFEEPSELTIRSDDNTILIQSGRIKFKLATLPAQQFPQALYKTPETTLSINRQILIKLIQFTQIAMSQQDVRVYLNSLLLEFNGNNFTTVATDGHRMAIGSATLDVGGLDQKLLLSRKSILEMGHLLAASTDETVTLMISQQDIKLQVSGYICSAKLLEARFPPYRGIIPTDHDKLVVIDKDIFKRALMRIMILAHEKSRAVTFTISDNTLTLTTSNQTQEEAVETLDAIVSGESIELAMNASYLLDVLNVLPEGPIRLSLTTMDRSVLVDSAENPAFQYIIMPVTQ